jgi:CopG family nickel-responsive transcriptional regulator
MGELVRFGISMEGVLLDSFDRLIEKRGYGNRSEAIRDLIRAALVEETWEGGDAETVGTLTLVYDHHHHDLADKLTQQQHAHHELIISTLHVHMDHHTCLEVLVLKGKGGEISRIANDLIAAKGVKHGRLVMTDTGPGS